jgi:hypothetical protein
LLAKPLPGTLSLFFSKLAQITLRTALIKAMACRIAKAGGVGMAHQQNVLTVGHWTGQVSHCRSTEAKRDD